MAKAFAVDSKKKDIIAFSPDDLVIVDDPKHPLFDPRGQQDADPYLVDSIIRIGIIEPIVVTRDDEDMPIVVAGRRRVLAAREANKQLLAEGASRNALIQVPATVRRANNPTKLFAVQIAENELRVDDTPLAKAKKVQRLLDYGATEDQAAKVFGCSESTIRNWLSLLEVAPRVAKAVEQGDIPPTAAYRLAKLPVAEQTDALAEVKQASGGRSRGAARAASETAKARTAKAKGEDPTPRMRSRKQIEERLTTKNLEPNYRAALRWVLGLTDAEAKTR